MARPNLSYLKNLALVLTGVAVGIWTGLTGMGAGLILSPALTWLIALRERPLAMVVLVVTTFASLFALLAYGQSHEVSLLPAVLFALTNAIGIRVGASAKLDRFRDSRAAPVSWSIATLVLAGWFMYSASHGAGSILSAHEHAYWPIPTWCGVCVSGLVSGFAAKIGNLGGLWSVPCLILIAGTTPLAAQATVLAALVIVSAVPTAVTLAKRAAPAVTAGWAAFGAILGAMTGSRIAVGLPSLRLVLIYGAGMYIVGGLRLFAAWPTCGPHMTKPPTQMR